MKITKCSSTIRSHSEITYLGLACSGTSWPIKALITMTGKSEHSYTLYLQFTVQRQNKIMACFIQLVDICLVSSRSNCKSFSELLFQAGDSSPWWLWVHLVQDVVARCALCFTLCVGSLRFPECRQRCEHYMLQILNH